MVPLPTITTQEGKTMIDTQATIEALERIGRLKSPSKNFEIYLMELPCAIAHARLQALDCVRSQG